MSFKELLAKSSSSQSNSSSNKPTTNDRKGFFKHHTRKQAKRRRRTYTFISKCIMYVKVRVMKTVKMVENSSKRNENSVFNFEEHE